jgi:hypothetical protein
MRFARFEAKHQSRVTPRAHQLTSSIQVFLLLACQLLLPLFGFGWISATQRMCQFEAFEISIA